MKSKRLAHLITAVIFAFCMKGGAWTDPKMYWTDSEAGNVYRANLDGSAVETLVTGLILPAGIAADPVHNKIYWITRFSDKRILCSNLDGSGVEDILATGLDAPVGITVDAINEKIYWTDHGGNNISRCNLDGTDVESLVTSISQPIDIKLDLSAGKMYWSDQATNKIQRSNLDGSDIEDIITGLGDLGQLSVDTLNHKIYWSNYGADKIQCANLDGTEITDLVTTGLSLPIGIDVDPYAGKIYWADAQSGKIQCAELDGSNVKDLVTGLNDPRCISIIPTPEPATVVLLGLGSVFVRHRRR
jgi:DNA-binding beta-propeller fold protein YncE